MWRVKWPGGGEITQHELPPSAANSGSCALLVAHRNAQLPGECGVPLAELFTTAAAGRGQGAESMLRCSQATAVRKGTTAWEGKQSAFFVGGSGKEGHHRMGGEADLELSAADWVAHMFCTQMWDSCQELATSQCLLHFIAAQVCSLSPVQGDAIAKSGGVHGALCPCLACNWRLGQGFYNGDNLFKMLERSEHFRKHL